MKNTIEIQIMHQIAERLDYKIKHQTENLVKNQILTQIEKQLCYPIK